jgi:tripartite-type tricarboxylate transporter receptor subunit TctC
MVSITNAMNATLYDKFNFNLIRDIAPVAGIVRVPLVMEVNPSVLAKTVPEFITYAKANPGKLSAHPAGAGILDGIHGACAHRLVSGLQHAFGGQMTICLRRREFIAGLGGVAASRV